jgi:hypothetical protein
VILKVIRFRSTIHRAPTETNKFGLSRKPYIEKRFIEGVFMNTQRPAVVTIAAILLIVLSLFVAGLGIANQFGLLGRGFGGRQFGTGQFRNRTFTPPNGSSPNGFSNNGVPNDQNNGVPNDQTNGGTAPNFTPNRQFRTGSTSLLRLLQPITIGLDILMLILAVVATIGLFKSKRWGAILAIVISIILILLAIPGMLRIFSVVVLVENLIRILLAITVVVLLLLPSARKSFATSKVSDQKEVERIVR